MATANGWNNQIEGSYLPIVLNAGTLSINIGDDAAANTISIGTGAAAKVVTLGSTNGASSLALKYGTADFSLASATGNVMVALDTGEVTKPLQPAFSARLATNAFNVTGDGTVYTIVYDAKLFDQNNDFDTGTGKFTAPVTGKYYFNVVMDLSGLLNTHTIGFAYMRIGAGPVQYVGYKGNPWAGSAGVGGEFDFTFSIFAAMTAGDTAEVVIEVAGGTKVVDIPLTGVASIRQSFSGYLVC